VAFRIPNLARSLVAEGALTSAFIPTFAGEVRRGPTFAQACLSSAVSAFSLLSLLLVVLGSVFAREVLAALAPGILDDPQYGELTVLLLRIMLPFLWCMSLVSVASGALSSLASYGSAALGQVVMNIFLVIVLLLSFSFTEQNRVIALSVAVLGGGILQILVHVVWARKRSLSLAPSADILSESNREIFRLMLPAVGATAVYQLGIVASTAIASTLEPGSISWLFYADRLAQLPLGVLSIALASVLLPALASADKKDYSDHLSNALRFNLFLIAPLAVFLAVQALPLIELLFERGRFTTYDTLQSARALQGYALGLVLVSSQMLLGRSFIADKDPRTPALCAALSLSLTLCCAVLLVGTPASTSSWLGAGILSIRSILPVEHIPALGHVGLALSPAIGAFCGCLLLLVLAVKRGYLSSVGFLVSSLWQILLALIPFTVLLTLEFWRGTPGLILSVVLATLAFLFTLIAVKNRECLETFALLRRIWIRTVGRKQKDGTGGNNTLGGE
jgi:putative peptidoglycan lipid II flippase